MQKEKDPKPKTNGGGTYKSCIQSVMKKKTFKDIRIWDKVYNNPRADKQGDQDQQKEKEDASKHTLYDARENTDIVKRMIKGYNKNRNKIKNQPNQPEVSQSEKRRRKLIDLGSRSSSWKGLENYDMNEDINDYVREFRKLYFSSRTMSFRKWLEEFENLLDTIQ